MFAAYHEALVALGAARRDSYLSIKYPSLGYSEEMLESLVREAKRLDVRLHFDALGPESVDRTWEAVEAALRQDADIGCTLPARWRRSPDDADWAARRGLAVRVVKGQWPDPTDAGIDPRRGFEAIVERLAGRARMVAVATHDLRTARAALRAAVGRRHAGHAGIALRAAAAAANPFGPGIRRRRREFICPTARPICRIACRS